MFAEPQKTRKESKSKRGSIIGDYFHSMPTSPHARLSRENSHQMVRHEELVEDESGTIQLN